MSDLPAAAERIHAQEPFGVLHRTTGGVSRRGLLIGSVAAACLAGCTDDDVNKGESSGSRQSSTGRLAPAIAASDPTVHLLRRLTYGLTAAERKRFDDLGREAWLDEQLRGDRDEADEVVDMVDRLNAALSLADLDPNKGNAREVYTGVMCARTLVRGAFSNNQLREVITDVWADHLHVSLVAAPDAFAVPAYDDILRNGALERFDDLLVSVSKSPAMVLYLDQSRSRADGSSIPNENFARELMELHTVGRDEYSEDDVKLVAHIFSGWSVDPERRFTFRPAWHSLGPADGADVLGFTPAGEGLADGEAFLRHLATQPATARRIARALAVRLVDDEIEADDPLVTAAARTYLDNDTSIAATIRSIVEHDEFDRRPASLLRRPLDHMISALRASSTLGSSAGADEVRALLTTMRRLGHVPYQWAAPDGFPRSSRSWSSAGSLITRWNQTLALTTKGIGNITVTLPAPQRDPDADAGAIVRHLLAGLDDPELTSQISSVLATKPGDTATRRVAAALVMSSPSFELR